ncbi:MAG: hypothetical protein HDS78_01450 [Bacteroidales bacterium]|nr:hypothetical protein [Bacteroidales bacterium]MBD5218991.1 hypothetical protein [Bacteroidales bacterium]
MNTAKETFSRIRAWLGSLSFRTGVIVAVCCLLFYAISFAQMLLPISVAAKGVLWTVFFGLAKAAQYSALLILGTTGVKRIKQYFKSSQQDL